MSRVDDIQAIYCNPMPPPAGTPHAHVRELLAEIYSMRAYMARTARLEYELIQLAADNARISADYDLAVRQRDAYRDQSGRLDDELRGWRANGSRL